MIRDYDQDAPNREETETATFALGCLWGPEAQYGDAECERVSLHHPGQDPAAFIDVMKRAVPSESS